MMSEAIDYKTPSNNMWWLIFGISVIAPLATFLLNPFQPVIEYHAFRQTQTAITSYWMQPGIAPWEYITPVVGYPWSVPFEFPFYQIIVAKLSMVTDLPLDFLGRLVSLVFVYLTCLPMLFVLRHHGLVACMIAIESLLTGPIGLFFSRTFLIESCATLLAFSSLCCYVTYRRNHRYAALAAFFVIGTLAGLQKITTFGPVILVCILDCVYLQFVSRAVEQRQTALKFFTAVSLILSSMIVPYAWTHLTDTVKSTGAISSYLTSKQLMQWNFGSISLRLHLEYWLRVFLARLLVLGGFSAWSLFIFAALIKHGLRINNEALLFLCAGLLGPLIFANLHYLHDYYQLGSLAFIAAGVGIVVSNYFSEMRLSVTWTTAVMGTAVAVNLLVFAVHYLPKVIHLDQRDHNALTIAEFVRTHTSPSDVVMIVGMDWSSEIPYLSQRYALMIPTSITSPLWPLTRSEIIKVPGSYIGTRKLGSLVYCDSSAQVSIEARDEQTRLAALIGGQTKVFDECLVTTRDKTNN